MTNSSKSSANPRISNINAIPWGDLGLTSKDQTIHYYGATIQIDKDYQLWQNINAVNATPAAISLSAFNNKLYGTWKANDASDQIRICDTSTPLQTWPDDTSLNGKDSTGVGPTVVPFAGALYLVFKGDYIVTQTQSTPNNHIYISKLENGKWLDGQKINARNSTPRSISATEFNGQLYLAYQSNDPTKLIRTCVQSHPLETWPKDHTLTHQDSTDSPPEIIAFKNKLYLFWLKDNNLYMAVSEDGSIWTKGITINNNFGTPIQGSKGISAAVSENTLYLSWNNKSGQSICLSSSNDPLSSWTQIRYISIKNAKPASTRPGLAYFNNRLFLLTIEDNHHIKYSNNGYNLSKLPTKIDKIPKTEPCQLSITGELLNGEINIHIPEVNLSRAGSFCVVKNPNLPEQPNFNEQSPMANEILAINEDGTGLKHIKWAKNGVPSTPGHKTGWIVEDLNLPGEDLHIDRVQAYYQGSRLLILIHDFGSAAEGLQFHNSIGFPTSPKANKFPPLPIKSWLYAKEGDAVPELFQTVSEIIGDNRTTHQYYQLFIDPVEKQPYLYGWSVVKQELQPTVSYFLVYAIGKKFQDFNNLQLYYYDTSKNAQYLYISMIGVTSLKNGRNFELLIHDTNARIGYTTIVAGPSNTSSDAPEMPAHTFPYKGQQIVNVGVMDIADGSSTLPIKPKSILLRNTNGYMYYLFQHPSYDPAKVQAEIQVLNQSANPKIVIGDPFITDSGFGQDADGLYRVFGVEPFHQSNKTLDQSGSSNTSPDTLQPELWLLRQTSKAASGKLEFAPGFIALGDHFNTIACPRVMLENGEVYGAIQEEASSPVRLIELHNAKVTGTWYEEEIKIPVETEKSNQASFYNTQIIVEDENGKVYPNYSLEIRASHRTTLYINGFLWRLDRYAPIIVQTNNLGKLVIETYANSINSASLMIHGAFMGKDEKGDLIYQVFDPGAESHKRLAARSDLTLKAANHIVVNGKKKLGPPSVTTEKFSGNTLKNNQVLPSKFTDGDANKVAGLIAKAAGKMVDITSKENSPAKPYFTTQPEKFSNALASTLGSGESTALMFTFQHKKNSVLVSTPQKNDMPDHVPPESAWSWISHEAGDVIHSIEHLAHHLEDEIEKLVVKIEDKINIWIHTINKEIKKFTLAFVDQIGQLVESIFIAIEKIVKDVENVIEKVIEFLKLLFDWKYIWRTKEKIQQLFESYTVNTYSATLIKLDDLANDFVNKLENLFNEGFDKLEQNFAGKTFNYGQTSPVYQRKSYTTFKEHGARMNYLSNHFHNAVGSSSASMSLGATYQGDASVLDDFIQFIQNISQDFQDKFQEFQTAISQDFQSSSNLLDKGIYAILKASQESLDFVLTAFKDLAALIIEIMQKVGNLFFDYIKNGEFSFLKWLFELLNIDDKITWLDIFSLILAVPVYLISDLLSLDPQFANVKNALRASCPHLPGNPWGDQCPGSSPQALTESSDIFDEVAALIFSIDYLFLAFETAFLDTVRASGGGASIPKPLTALVLFQQWVQAITTVPYKTYAKPDYDMTIFDYVVIGISLNSFMIRSANSANFISQKGPTPQIFIFNSLLGVLLLGLGIGASTLAITEGKENWAKIFEWLVKPLPATSKILLVGANPEAIYPYIVPVLDLICDLPVAILYGPSRNAG